MALHDEFERQGNWLFQWQSYLPLVVIPLIAIAHVNYGYLWGSYTLHEYWEVVCVLISFLGLFVRCLAVGYAPAGTSDRNTDGQRAEELNTMGIYSFVRHPLYFGNFLIGLGVALTPMVWWLPVAYMALFVVYYERIMFAEEAFLARKVEQEFIDWAATVPAFVPNLQGWRQPTLPFSLRNVLRREYPGLLAVVLLHCGAETIEHLFVDHRIVWEPKWEAFLLAGLIAYVSLRLLKKHTVILDVPGR